MSSFDEKVSKMPLTLKNWLILFPVYAIATISPTLSLRIKLPVSGKPIVESTSRIVEPTLTLLRSFVLGLTLNSPKIEPVTLISLAYPESMLIW